jgi:hypothetical protein
VCARCGPALAAVEPAAAAARPPIEPAGVTTVVLDCIAPGKKRGKWVEAFAKDERVQRIEVTTMGDLVEASAALTTLLPNGYGDEVGAVIVVEPYCLFEVGQVSTVDQVGVAHFAENTIRGLRKAAEHWGVTAEADSPIPVLGCSLAHGLLQLSAPSMWGCVPPGWVHTEDGSLLPGNRPLPQAVRAVTEAVSEEWRRNADVSDKLARLANDRAERAKKKAGKAGKAEHKAKAKAW